jgi:hypothetical protein
MLGVFLKKKASGIEWLHRRVFAKCALAIYTVMEEPNLFCAVVHQRPLA